MEPTPVEALYDIITSLAVSEDWRRRFPKPGQILEHYKTTRRLVAGLTSQDALRMRFEPVMVMDTAYERRRRERQLKLSFDARLS